MPETITTALKHETTVPSLHRPSAFVMKPSTGKNKVPHRITSGAEGKSYRKYTKESK